MTQRYLVAKAQIHFHCTTACCLLVDQMEKIFPIASVALIQAPTLYFIQIIKK